MGKFDDVLVIENDTDTLYFLHKNCGIAVYDVPTNDPYFMVGKGTLVTANPDYALRYKAADVIAVIKDPRDLEYHKVGTYVTTTMTRVHLAFLRE